MVAVYDFGFFLQLMASWTLCVTLSFWWSFHGFLKPSFDFVESGYPQFVILLACASQRVIEI